MFRNIAASLALVAGLAVAVVAPVPVFATGTPISIPSSESLNEFRDAVFVAIDEEIRLRTERIRALRERLAETSDPAVKAALRARIATLRDRRQTLRELRDSVYEVSDRRVLRLYERFVGPVSLS